MKFRQLKSHEKKLVKKVDFLNWKTEENVGRKIRVISSVKEYGLSGNDEFNKYNYISKQVNSSINELLTKKSEENDVSLKRYIDDQLQLIYDKLYAMGVLDSKTEYQEQFTKYGIPTERFLRRRLNYVMSHELEMGEDIKKTTQYIKDGHVKVGPKTVTDPAFLVTRTLEDYVTWSSKSKIRRTILKYNNVWDDFEIENC